MILLLQLIQARTMLERIGGQAVHCDNDPSKVILGSDVAYVTRPKLWNILF
jgi:hypothetical protein